MCLLRAVTLIILPTMKWDTSMIRETFAVVAIG